MEYSNEKSQHGKNRAMAKQIKDVKRQKQEEEENVCVRVQFAEKWQNEQLQGKPGEREEKKII